jgi:uncharacterized repeat protein (TIGR03803 family)
MRRRRVLELLTVATIVITLPLVTAGAQTYTDFHDFNCAIEGCGPTYTSQLAQGRDGNIYGTASGGPGSSGNGTVFKITPEGVLTTVHAFDGTNGSNPDGGLALGPDGNLYGTTQFGTNNMGTIFKVTPGGVLTTLHAFPLNTVNGGGGPMTAPTLGSDGNFYGLTGGSGGGMATGIAYRYSLTSGYKMVASLTNALPGSGFFAPLIQGWDGNFYSTAYAGGTNGSGTVYSMSPSGVIKVIYNFDTTHGGWGYAPLVQDASGYLYGTEAQGGTLGGGVVFRVNPTNGRLALLHNFIHQDQSGGSVPAGGLVLATDGNLYGSTYWGGSKNDGVLFKVTKSGVYTQLFDLDGADGAATESTAIQHTNGKIYGISMNGGAYGGGVLYSFDVGARPFIALLFNAGKVGKSVGVLGQGFKTTKSVLFNGHPATYKVISDTYLTAVVPSGATTGFVNVTTSTGSMKSNRKFVVQP